MGEDAAQRNRIYVPLDELEQFGIAEEEVSRGAGTACAQLCEYCTLQGLVLLYPAGAVYPGTCRA